MPVVQILSPGILRHTGRPGPETPRRRSVQPDQQARPLTPVSGVLLRKSYHLMETTPPVTATVGLNDATFGAWPIATSGQTTVPQRGGALSRRPDPTPNPTGV